MVAHVLAHFLQLLFEGFDVGLVYFVVIFCLSASFCCSSFCKSVNPGVSAVSLQGRLDSRKATESTTSLLLGLTFTFSSHAILLCKRCYRSLCIYFSLSCRGLILIYVGPYVCWPPSVMRRSDLDCYEQAENPSGALLTIYSRCILDMGKHPL